MNDYSQAMRHEWAGEEQDAADERFADEEVTAVMSPTALENEELRARIANARSFVLSALAAVEAGHTLPLLALDSVLTKALQHLGCAECGKTFSVEDVRELACVRTNGIHAGHCS